MKKRIVEPHVVNTTRLVKSEDLNHHKTLFAGRTAEWVVEAGFLAAAKLINPKWLVCMKIHGMHFTHPVHAGDILDFTSKVVFTGISSLTSYIEVAKSDSSEPYVSGFITYVFVDENTNAIPHNIEVVPISDEDIVLHDKAKSLTK